MSITLGRAHELGLAVALSTSTLIVLLGGAFPPWAWLVAFAPLVAMWVRRRGVAVPAASGTLLALAAVAAGVVTVVRGGVEVAVFAGGATLLGLLAARSLTSTTLDHDLQAIALSLVLVLAGSVLNVSLSYFLLFIAYAIASVWALATRQLLAGAERVHTTASPARERTDIVTPSFFLVSGGVSLVVLGAAVALFVSFPRIGFGELGFLAQGNSRLPQSVGFGSDPRGLNTSTEVIARVTHVPLAAFNDGLYLRAIVYDDVSLDAFSQSTPTTIDSAPIDIRPQLLTLARDDEHRATVEVALNPGAGDLTFSLGHTTAAQSLQGGAANPNRSVQVAGRDRHDQLRATSALASPWRYRLVGTLSAPGRVPPAAERAPQLSDEDRARYLRVVDDDRAVHAVVDSVRGGDVDALPAETRATRLRTYLLTKYRYSLDGGVANRDHALKAFLLEVRAGHCELFAGGFALMLRMAGVPARVIGGYQGGAMTDDGAVVFQARHAHAWVEWWKDGVGWIVDDATPEATDVREHLSGFALMLEGVRKFWDDTVLDYSFSDQQAAVSDLTRALRGKNLGKLAKALAAALVVGGGAVLLLRRVLRARRAARGADQLGDEIAAALARLGHPVRPHETLREAVAHVGVHVGVHVGGVAQAGGEVEHDGARVLDDALAVYEGGRFGGVVVDGDRVDALRRALRALRRPP